MKRFTVNIALSLILGTVATTVLLWLLGGGAVPVRAQGPDGYDTYYVALGGDCGTASPCHSTIQAAVDAADSSSDVIKVAAGTYTGVSARAGVTQSVYVSKTVGIRGGYTTTDWATSYPISQATILDAQGQGRVLYIRGHIRPKIHGLHVANGDATGLGGRSDYGGSMHDAGGGVYVLTATVSISHTRIYSSRAEWGGGLYLWHGAAAIYDSTVTSNTADYGGGLYLGSSGAALTLAGNTVAFNSGGVGGGLYLAQMGGTTDLTGNTFSSNRAHYGGGGLYLWLYGSNAVISGNTISANTSAYAGGGGVYLSGSATLTGNTISANVAVYNGGGAYLSSSDATLDGNDVVSNTAHISGGGLYLWHSDAVLTGNTVISNVAQTDGGGLCLGHSDAVLTGNTVSSNTAHIDGGGLYLEYAEAVLTGNTVSSNTAYINGGGLSLAYADAVLRGNTISSNTARIDGGGLYLEYSGAIIASNVVIANAAHDAGGGMYLRDGDPTLVNNVVVDNRANTGGSGLYVESSHPRLLHSTIARNTGGDGSGVYVTGWNATVALTNTVLASQIVGIYVDSGTAWLEATLWGGGAWANGSDWDGGAIITGTANLWGDPDFVDPSRGDYHIGGASAARDAGVDAGIDRDIDNQVRPMAWKHDIGADEYSGVGLDVVKRPSAAFVNRGQVVTYTIYVTSAGTVEATGVVLTDTLDGWQRPMTATSSAGGCSVTDGGWGGAVVCTPGTLAIGQTAVVMLTAQVSTSTPIRQAMANTVVVTANETTNNTRAVVYAQDCHVRIDGDPTAYANVQAAVDVASPGDLVKVAGYCVGVYERGGLRQQAYLDKNLILRGGYTSTSWTAFDPLVNQTTLDALGQGRVLYIGGNISPVVQGLRITGGDSAGLGGAPLDRDAGGGVYVIHARATISNCQVFDNRSVESAGSSFGGGIYLEKSASTLAGNVISANTSIDGGGLYLFGSDATLDGNVVITNTAARGGGLSLDASSATLLNNIVADNRASSAGSGAYIGGSSPRLLHNTFARNDEGEGSGIYVTSSSYHHSTVWLTNTILVDHSVGITVALGSAATLEATLWGTATWANETDQGGAGVIITGTPAYNYWGDPAFVDPGNGDYHVDAHSAAIDRGVKAGIAIDVDDNPRPLGTGYDIGADEFVPWIYLPVVFRD